MFLPFTSFPPPRIGIRPLTGENLIAAIGVEQGNSVSADRVPNRRSYTSVPLSSFLEEMFFFLFYKSSGLPSVNVPGGWVYPRHKPAQINCSSSTPAVAADVILLVVVIFY